MRNTSKIICFLYGRLFGFLLKYIYVKYTGDINEVVQETSNDKQSIDFSLITADLKRILFFWMFGFIALFILDMILRFIYIR